MTWLHKNDHVETTIAVTTTILHMHRFSESGHNYFTTINPVPSTDSVGGATGKIHSRQIFQRNAHKQVSDYRHKRAEIRHN